DGSLIGAPQETTGGICQFHEEAERYFDAIATVTVKLGAAERTVELPLKSKLAGFAAGGTLDPCLLRGGTARDCFGEAGISVPAPPKPAPPSPPVTPPSPPSPPVTPPP